MKTFMGAAAFGLGATAAVLPRQQEGCCFQLTASGGQSGTLSQLTDGQNRIMNGNGGADAGAATYCINNGALTDASGRGCILTAPTTQFQCDTGATPQPGFSVNGNGMLEYGSDSTFYACAATDSSYNIYTNTSSAQTGCSEISLSTGGECENTNMGASSATYTTTATQFNTATAYETVTSVSVSASASPTTATDYNTNTVVSVSASPYASPTTETKYNTNTVVSVSASPYASPTTEYNTNTVYNTDTNTVVSVSASAYASPTTEIQYMTVTETVTQTPAYCSSLAASVSSLQATCYTQQATVTETPAYCSSLSASVASLQSQTAPATVTQATVPAGYSSVGTNTAPAGYSSNTAPAGTAPASNTAPYGSNTAPYASNTAPAATNTYPANNGNNNGNNNNGNNNGNGNGNGNGNNGGAKGTACQTGLSGAYQTPHLIVPVSSESPDSAYGTSYNGQVNSTASSMFNFDIPASYAGMQCSVIFMLPEKSDLETADYTMSSNGGSIMFSEMSSSATQEMTWNSAPKSSEMQTIAVQPGNTYVVANMACPAGQVESIEMSSVNGMALNFFEDYNPSPLGLYITAC